MIEMASQNIKRINLQLNLADKEDKEIYGILRKKKNMSNYIRNAILYFNKGIKLDPILEETLKKIIGETVRNEIKDSLNVPAKESRNFSPPNNTGQALEKIKINRKEVSEEEEEQEPIEEKGDDLQPEDLLNLDGLDAMF